MSALTTGQRGPTPILERGQQLLGRFGLVLATLFSLLVVAGFAAQSAIGLEIFSLSITLVLGTGVYALGRRRWVLAVGLGIGVPAFAIEWISNYNPSTALVMANLFSFLFFLVFLAAVIAYEILHEDRIHLDTILGGITIYILFGIGWAFAYSVVEHLMPGSYPSGGVALQELRPRFEFVFPELLYFSFVTLTTLGYGDIAPTNPPARMLALFEAIVGQLYVAVAIAVLVGLHLSQMRPDKSDRLGPGPDS
ncbi:MAG: potassium channel family protein [Myxococcota bacterium]|nr:potassium channel family protein [Myxococcota bacterium]